MLFAHSAILRVNMSFLTVSTLIAYSTILVQGALKVKRKYKEQAENNSKASQTFLVFISATNCSQYNPKTCQKHFKECCR